MCLSYRREDAWFLLSWSLHFRKVGGEANSGQMIHLARKKAKTKGGQWFWWECKLVQPPMEDRMEVPYKTKNRNAI